MTVYVCISVYDVIHACIHVYVCICYRCRRPRAGRAAASAWRRPPHAARAPARRATESTPAQMDWVWRIVLLFGFFPASCTMYIRATLPETPRYTLHVMNDKARVAAEMSGVVKEARAHAHTHTRARARLHTHTRSLSLSHTHTHTLAWRRRCPAW